MTRGKRARYVARMAPSRGAWWVVRVDPDGSEWLVAVQERKRDAEACCRDLEAGGMSRGGAWLGLERLAPPRQLSLAEMPLAGSPAGRCEGCGTGTFDTTDGSSWLEVYLLADRWVCSNCGDLVRSRERQWLGLPAPLDKGDGTA